MRGARRMVLSVLLIAFHSLSLPIEPRGDGSAHINLIELRDENENDDENALSSVESALEPDSIVFNDRNFIGYPREPDADGFGVTNAGYLNPHKSYMTIPHIVKEHETVYTIADLYHVSPSLLVSFNEDVADPMLLNVGDVLQVPVPRVITITSLSPSESPLEGGVAVEIRGSGFVYPTHCKFGNMIVRASRVSDELVVCTTSEQKEPGNATVAISDGKGNFQQTPFTIQYSGGSIPFCDEPGARASWCRPRKLLTPPPPTTEPAAPEPAPVAENVPELPEHVIVYNYTRCQPEKPVEIKRINATVANKTLARPPPEAFSVSSIYPHKGPSVGGTSVVIRGRGLATATHCVFDNTERILADHVNATEVHCTTPYHNPASVDVRVARLADDGEYKPESKSSVSYTFQLLATRVDSIHPTNGSIAGGTLVSVRGTGFTLGSFCRFGIEEVPVVYYSPTHVACYSPEVPTIQTVNLEVSQLIASEGFTTDELVFLYGSDQPAPATEV